MLLNDKKIRDLCLNEKMIEPFADIDEKKQSKIDGKMSYGLDGSGYDIRISKNYQVMKQTIDGRSLDPKNKDNERYYLKKTAIGGVIEIEPYSTIRVRSLEKFNMPNNVKGLSHQGKSTYTRNGLEVLMTPIDEGYSGYITFVIANHTHLAQKVYAEEGIAQITFWEIEDGVETSYADRDGKYMNSEDIEGSKI